MPVMADGHLFTRPAVLLPFHRIGAALRLGLFSSRLPGCVGFLPFESELVQLVLAPELRFEGFERGLEFLGPAKRFPHWAAMPRPADRRGSEPKFPGM